MIELVDSNLDSKQSGEMHTGPVPASTCGQRRLQQVLESGAGGNVNKDLGWLKPGYSTADDEVNCEFQNYKVFAAYMFILHCLKYTESCFRQMEIEIGINLSFKRISCVAKWYFLECFAFLYNYRICML